MSANPLFTPALTALLVGLAGLAAGRLAPLPPRLRAALAALVFVAAYIAVYDKVFPVPRGATDKLFYAGLFGLLLPFLPGGATKAGASVLVLLPTLWIALPRLAAGESPIPFILILAGGLLLLLRFASLAASARPGAGTLAWAMALALFGGGAAVALVGGSASGLLLLLALVVGYAPWALAALLAPRPEGPALTALWSGPLALAAILLLITRAEDGSFLLVLLLLVLAVGEGVKRGLARSRSPRLLAFAGGLALLILTLGVIGALHLAAPEAFSP